MPAFQSPCGIFITGADTGVGKTWVASRLLEGLRRRGLRPHPLKPVESGCAGLGAARDAEVLRMAAALDSIESITRFSLDAPLAPALAARREGVDIRLRELVEFCGGPDLRVVEGAGGWRVPLACDGEVRDLASALGLPILVVAADRLGAVNHTLLTCEAIRQTPNCRLGGVLLNQCNSECEEVGNSEMLQASLQDVPLWRCSFGTWLDEAREAELLRIFGLLEGIGAGVAGS